MCAGEDLYFDIILVLNKYFVSLLFIILFAVLQFYNIICTRHLDEKGFINPDYLRLIESINGTVLFDKESIQELIDNFQTVRNSSQLMSQFGESSPKVKIIL
jgi:hypothetical protein